MLNDLDLLVQASSLARHAAARHAVLAQNVANADTPGYRARDVEPFARSYARAREWAREGKPSMMAADPRIVEPELPASPDGNSVVIEDQMLRAAETESRHRLAMTVYGKTLDLLRLGLGRMR